MDNNKKNINTITTFKMKFMQRTACYTKWDHRRNEDTTGKLKIKPVIDYIHNYQRKWKEHMNRMNTGRIPWQILCYQPRGQKSVGHPMKRWEENMTS